MLPIGNVHPNALGYSVLAADIAATPVPEPTGLAVALGALGFVARGKGRVS